MPAKVFLCRRFRAALGVAGGFVAFLLLALLTGSSIRAAAAAKAPVNLAQLPAPVRGPVDYAKDIQPILAKNCYACHGAEKQKSGLRLDRKADALLGGDSGKIILPGKSAESILIHNVAGLDPDTIMPPEDERLTAAEIGKLRAWIDAGAVWPDDAPASAGKDARHWAFKPAERASVPRVKDKTWIRNPIDAFVLARLEKEKIAPSPEADRPALLRRLSLDLLGLLPTPEEAVAFANDTRPDTYERVVDRLLASPHFGERWGRHWLDLARYADSDGYEADRPRPYAYLFRDWVIDAINRDLPFDQFTIEQLAGDLLPNASDQQKRATGFHRQTLTTREGGVDKEEFRTKATVDRVSTTGAAWLGLTVGCAECHTHKFDPITQREFYQLYAFFNNASEKDIPAPRPEELAAYERQMKTWEAKETELEPALQAYLQGIVETKLPEWERTLKRPSARWSVLTPQKVLHSIEDVDTPLKAGKDHTISSRPRDPLHSRFTIETKASLQGVTGFRVEVLDEPGKTVGLGAKGDFALSEFTVAVRTGDGEPRKVELASAEADFAVAGGEAAKAIDGENETGWSIGPQTHRDHVIVFATKTPLDLPAGATLIFQFEHHTVGLINRFRLAATTSAGPLEPSTLPDAIGAILDTPREQRSESQHAALRRYFGERVDEKGRVLREGITAHTAKKPKFPETTAAILEAEERKTHVHTRGDFLRPGDEVEPATLRVLHPFHPRGDKPDRLDLARWLVDPANPLTPRVTVNHVWKNLFGRALVSSVNDFGTRGEKPSHPELLDWLAVTFASTPNAQLGLGWSRKALIRLIVTSAAYRQSSATRPELVAHDPNNVLLARQNRFRLDAENVRDIYLAASGLLNPAIGGPSMRPQLPADIAALGYANSVKWEESKGAERYRRGLYIFFQRTVPYPMLMTFDAPDSNTTCTARERSNTPLQALALLNDPVFFECAQALGSRVAGEPVPPEEKMRRAFRLCLTREPSPAELERLQRLYFGQKQMMKNQPENAALIAGEATPEAADREEKATLIAVSRVIMNLDEFVTRD